MVAPPTTHVSGEDIKRQFLRSIAERAAAASVSDPDPDPGAGVTAPDFREASREDVARELWLRQRQRIGHHNLRAPA